MITVACVWVRGHVPYTAEYVVNLRAMVARHLAMPHRFVCLTDQPSALPKDMYCAMIQSPRPHKGWWAKMRLFDPDLESALGRFRRVLYLDLDTLVVGDLAPIAHYPSDFALIPPGGTFRPPQHETVRRFNSSVMVWTIGEPTRALWGQYSPKVAARYWGDQDFLGATLPTRDPHVGQTMPGEWFPRLSDLNEAPPGPDARVVLTKTPKNHIAADLFPWFAEMWRVA